jgi:hypothetical protein
MLDSRGDSHQELLLDEHLYEVHIAASEEGPWERASGFDTLEAARIEAVHLIRDTPAHAVRVMHVVDYYRKTADVGQA